MTDELVPGMGPEEAKIVVAISVQQRVALNRHVLLMVGSRAREVRAERHHHAGQRRVLRFVLVNSLVQPLHAAGNVSRFIGSVIEHRVRDSDSYGGQQNQCNYDCQGALAQKRFQAFGKWGRRLHRNL